MRVVVIHHDPGAGSPEDDWLSRSRQGTDITPGLYNRVEAELFTQVHLIHSCLTQGGHDVSIFCVNDVSDLVHFLRREPPDLVFNCCEAFVGRAQLEMCVAALLDLLQIPYTGSPALALGVAQNKPLAKSVLGGCGIPTPRFLVVPVDSDYPTNALGFPVIVKPVAEDGSIGIDDGAVVHDSTSLHKRIRFVWDEFRQPALVEEFIAGREFHVSLLAASDGSLTALPISEIDFAFLAQERPRILGYEAKWDPNASFKQERASRCPAKLDPALAQRMRAMALAAARAVGMRDYARVDFRLRDEDEALFVIEINPNPDLDPDCEFLRAARAAGLTNDEAVGEIVKQAALRSGLT